MTEFYSFCYITHDAHLLLEQFLFEAFCLLRFVWIFYCNLLNVLSNYQSRHVARPAASFRNIKQIYDHKANTNSIRLTLLNLEVFFTYLEFCNRIYVSGC